MKIKKFDSINVVPFIDIMLVLLVIVLTTATFIAKGIIPVDLPEASSATKQKEKKDLTITLKKNGDIFFDKVAIDKKDVSIMLAKYKNSIPIRINCDKEAKFDSFVFILDILREKKFKNLGIITRNE